MRYRVMRNGTGQYYIQYRRFFLWWDYQLPVDVDMSATVTFPTEAKAVECVHRLLLERERPILVKEYVDPALAQMQLDDISEAKKRIAAAESALAAIFNMYNPVERQSQYCAVTRAIRGYYDKYPFPVEDKQDE